MVEIYPVVKKLIGDIEPVGDSNVDKKRLENIKQHIDLVSMLLHDLQCVRHNKDRAEYSMKIIGKRADDFFNTIVS